MNETLTLQFDGGSRGNPGPAGIGIVVAGADGTPLITLGRFIGRATNNVAEYKALITAMEEAKKLGAKKILIRGDSELIIKQMKGEYRVKHPDMKVLYEQAQELIAEFDQAKIEHNLRHKNELADLLANLAMDRRGDVTEVPGATKTSSPSSPLDEPAARETQSGDAFGCAMWMFNPGTHRIKDSRSSAETICVPMRSKNGACVIESGEFTAAVLVTIWINCPPTRSTPSISVAIKASPTEPTLANANPQIDRQRLPCED